MITIIEERNLFLGVNSVNKFGEIWPLGLNFKSLGQIFVRLCSTGQNFEPTLTNFWAIFHGCK